MKNTLTLFAFAFAMHTNAQTTNPAPYCDVPINMASTTCKGGITNVSIGTLSNTTTLTGKYTYYDNIPAPILYRGMSYTLSMTFDTVATTCRPASSKWLVIMAYENSGVGIGTSFITPIDSVYSGDATNFSTPITKTVNIPIPITAPIGHIRMRVIRYGLPSSTGMGVKCIDGGGGSSDYYLVGETEDYNIRILDPISMGLFETQNNVEPIYTNPCTDKFKISVSGVLNISNGLGQIVYSNKNYDKELIDVSFLPVGMYIANINGKSYRISKF